MEYLLFILLLLYSFKEIFYFEYILKKKIITC